MKQTSTGSGASVGVIGGSGLYDIEGLTAVREMRVRTPFGTPSDAIVVGILDGTRVAFLSRHGRGHRLSPSEINYRANIYALKSLGVSRVISISAVGSMKDSIRPGDVVLPDQFIDLTKRRAGSFFEGGMVAHVAFGEPICAGLAQDLEKAAHQVGAALHCGGTYLCMEGPQFSTKAESRLYRQWGVDVIGMTNMPEAKLAREAELCYATIALVTDYDCWHDTEDRGALRGRRAGLFLPSGAGQRNRDGAQERAGGSPKETRPSHRPSDGDEERSAVNHGEIARGRIGRPRYGEDAVR
jgi:5'-methylthioadenosine phosphorylase